MSQEVASPPPSSSPTAPANDAPEIPKANVDTPEPTTTDSNANIVENAMSNVKISEDSKGETEPESKDSHDIEEEKSKADDAKISEESSEESKPVESKTEPEPAEPISAVAADNNDDDNK